MKLKLGMPEVLVLFSLFMFSQSFWFSIVAFSLGVLGRFFDFVMEKSLEQKKADALNSEINNAADTIRNIFGTNSKNEH